MEKESEKLQSIEEIERAEKEEFIESAESLEKLDKNPDDVEAKLELSGKILSWQKSQKKLEELKELVKKKKGN